MTATATNSDLYILKFAVPPAGLPFIKAQFSIIRVDLSDRLRQLALFVKLGMLEFTYRFQTFRILHLAVRYLVESEATLRPFQTC